MEGYFGLLLGPYKEGTGVFASSWGRDSGNTVSLTDLELHQVRQAHWPGSSTDPLVSSSHLDISGITGYKCVHDTKVFHRRDGDQIQALLFVSQVLC